MFQIWNFGNHLDLNTGFPLDLFWMGLIPPCHQFSAIFYTPTIVIPFFCIFNETTATSDTLTGTKGRKYNAENGYCYMLHARLILYPLNVWDNTNLLLSYILHRACPSSKRRNHTPQMTHARCLFVYQWITVTTQQHPPCIMKK